MKFETGDSDSPPFGVLNSGLELDGSAGRYRRDLRVVPRSWNLLNDGLNVASYSIDSVEDKFVQSTLFENLCFTVSARRTVERLFCSRRASMGDHHTNHV